MPARVHQRSDDAEGTRRVGGSALAGGADRPPLVTEEINFTQVARTPEVLPEPLQEPFPERTKTEEKIIQEVTQQRLAMDHALQMEMAGLGMSQQAMNQRAMAQQQQMYQQQAQDLDGSLRAMLGMGPDPLSGIQPNQQQGLLPPGSTIFGMKGGK